jgi:hypothetical protein
MTTKHMLIIKDARGEIIAAQVEESAASKVQMFISPAQPQHTLHRLSDVPAEIHNIAHPEEFRKAITDHVKSGKAKVTQTSAEELNAPYHQALASRGK